MRLSTVGLTLLISAGAASSGCGLSRPASPAATFRTFYRAVRAEDLVQMKASVSGDSIALGEQLARAQNETLDEQIRDNDGERSGLGDEVPEIGTEKIDGDRATIEVKHPRTGDWVQIPLVKENGTWKIAVDKLIRSERM